MECCCFGCRGWGKGKGEKASWLLRCGWGGVHWWVRWRGMSVSSSCVWLTQIYFSQFQRPEAQGPCSGWFGFLLRTLPGADGCLLSVSSHDLSLCVHLWGWGRGHQFSWIRAPQPMTSFNFYYLLKALFPNIVTLRVRTSKWILRGTLQSH